MVTEIDFKPRPTPDRPLLGLTILVVEDSHTASEALRLMCLRSGARIRRADCLASAERHLNVYRPSVAIVDLGLPDGSGLDLIARMARMRPRVPIVLGTSGAERAAAAADAARAGADGFLAKPVPSLAAFQDAVGRHLPEALRPTAAAAAATDDAAAALPVAPDPLALREDLTHAMDLLALDAPPVGYLRRFLIGLARAAGDRPLEGRAAAMDGGFAGQDRIDLRALISDRLRGLSVAL